MANRALHALLFGGDDALRQRVWEAGVDTGVPLDVAVVVPSTELVAKGVVTVPLGGHVALLGAEVPRRLLQDGGATAVVTRAEAGVEPIRQAYRLVRAAARAAAKVGHRGAIPLQDVLYLAALDGDPTARSAYVHAVLDPLLEAGRSFPMVPTLIAAQDAGWNTARSATALGVAGNTAWCRLNIVQELTQLRLRDGRDRERLSFAVWLWRLGVR